MKIALVGPELEENLALRHLHAAALQAGHEALIFNFVSPDDTPAIAEHILAYKPDLVGLSMVFTGRAREFAQLAEQLKQLGYSGHITAGGHFASFHDDRLLADIPAIDSIVHGEGEETLVDLAQNLANPANVTGISYRENSTIVHTAKRTVRTALDDLPWPTRTPPFHTYLGVPIANMLSSRGCFGNCNFCSIAAWHKKTGGPRLRQRAPQAVAKEMAMLYHSHGVRIFNFHDDNFFLPSQEENLTRFRAIKSALDAEGVGRIAIQVKARPDSINEEVVDCLVELGLFRVFLGVESNAVAGLRTLGRGIRREQNHEALRILEAAGIHTSFNLLMFDPETTLQDLTDNADFLDDYARFPLNFGRVEAYTGTPLEIRLRDTGRLTGDYWGHSYQIADPRAEAAFQLFKSVFIPRNFEGDAVNFLGMKVDYLRHVLSHFHPEEDISTLTKECRVAIESLNRNSVMLLKTILAYVAEADISDHQSFTALEESLCSQRYATDKLMHSRLDQLTAQIQKLAASKTPRRFPLQAAAAAAAAIVITVSGCQKNPLDHHMCEMMMEPMEEPHPPEQPPEKPEEVVPDKPVIPPDWHMCEMMMKPIEPAPEKPDSGNADL
jgi:anaerobic magnesium-protoporphyrin IX monomethyl ester cyclase